jgi:hypothetical protein
MAAIGGRGCTRRAARDAVSPQPRGILTGYIDGAGLRADPKGPLFRTIGRGTGKLTRTVLPQANAYAMIGRRCGRRRHRNQARQPQLSGDEDHTISQERRHSRKGGGDGKSRVDAHDTALRSPAR